MKSMRQADSMIQLEVGGVVSTSKRYRDKHFNESTAHVVPMWTAIVELKVLMMMMMMILFLLLLLLMMMMLMLMMVVVFRMMMMVSVIVD